MTAPERRERERQALRAKILQAARDLFLAHGIEAVTMRKIADAVEYTPPVLYAHFADKSALLTALCEEDLTLFHAALQRAARRADPVERIRRMGKHYVDFALEHPHHYRLLFMTPFPEEQIAAKAAQVEEGTTQGQSSYALLRDAVAECIATGRFEKHHKDAERVAQVLWGAVHGVVSLWILHARNPEIEWRAPRATAFELVDAALDGLCIGAAATSRTSS
ncbi:MAG: TetR/AcrR family transcriptional regulator [Planctomycetota bacterium]|nr:TetR/AcrR family transcriptional regulator [Planctomycetota bacterium]